MEGRERKSRKEGERKGEGRERKKERKRHERKREILELSIIFSQTLKYPVCGHFGCDYDPLSAGKCGMFCCDSHFFFFFLGENKTNSK